MAKDLVFDLSPTQSAFVHTDAHIAVLQGPMGEGKTYAGAVALPRHAVRCRRNIRGAIVRDTHQNLKLSTIPDMREMFGDRITFHDDEKRGVLHTDPKVELDLFGIDDAASVSKLQGPQYAVIWAEEPCPVLEKSNAGLPREVFDIAIARAARQPGTVPRVQITMNPGNPDHWSEVVIAGPEVYAVDPVTGEKIIKKVFRIPYRENKRLSSFARAANIAAFQGDPAMYARYVEGRAAYEQQGRKVTPGYNDIIMYSPTELPVVPGAPLILAFDAWHDPVCILAQTIPPGRLWVHDVVMESGIGVEQLASQLVEPLLASGKYHEGDLDMRLTGDPSMQTPDQSSTERSAAKSVSKIFNLRFEPGPTRWNYRERAMQSVFSTICADGSPMLRVSASAHALHRALLGGWHFKTDGSGKRLIGEMPIKNIHDHVGMAFAYLAALVTGKRGQREERPKSAAEARLKSLARACAYAPTLGSGR